MNNSIQSTHLLLLIFKDTRAAAAAAASIALRRTAFNQLYLTIKLHRMADYYLSNKVRHSLELVDAASNFTLVLPNELPISSERNWLSAIQCNTLSLGPTEIIQFTYYLAESLSWYSLERPKHSCTPLSTQSRFMAASSSSENGSVSSIRVMTSTTILASDCEQ